MQNLKGYINTKQILHITYVTLGVAISGGGIAALTSVMLEGPAWVALLGSALPGMITWFYQILKNIDSGTPVNSTSISSNSINNTNDIENMIKVAELGLAELGGTEDSNISSVPNLMIDSKEENEPDTSRKSESGTPSQ